MSADRLIAFWRAHRALLLEAFLILNLAALAGDILLAHAVNRFARWEEWIPFAYCLGAALVLSPLHATAWRAGGMARWRRVFVVTGVLGVAVGVAGMGYHLASQFLREQTVKNLVYTAPFVAPLAFAGVGSLLIINRTAPHDQGWAFAPLFGALGGFFGNFVLALCDHAQNGFFHATEWLAVVAAAFATAFLVALILVSQARAMIAWVAAVMAIQALVGALGFVFHVRANLAGPAESMLRNFIHGTPAFAPLLFVNLAVLAGFGLLDLWLQPARAGAEPTARAYWPR